MYVVFMLYVMIVSYNHLEVIIILLLLINNMKYLIYVINWEGGV